MAISKNRKTHTQKVAERYDELIAMRLAGGMTRKGFAKKDKTSKKGTPHRNPNRVNMNKSQKRVAKALRRSEKGQ